MGAFKKNRATWISHSWPWVGFSFMLWPLVQQAERAVVFPPGFGLKQHAFFLVLTAIGSFYLSFFYVGRIVLHTGTSIITRDRQKQLNVLYYLVAAIAAGVFIFYLFLGDTLSDIQQLMGSLYVDVFLFFAFLGILIQFQKRAIIKSNENQLELSKAQLALLRSQINPHFLFNTLHNIDTLIVQHPEKASKCIIMLSDSMRYMMRDVQSEQVFLSKEIDYLRNYVTLEKLRSKNDTFVRFEVSGSTEGLFVAPMLLIPFVENAFKHAVDSDREQGITIQLLIEGHQLTFTCLNNFDPTETEKDSTHGIGLETVRKRLELLYPTTHQLTINKEQSMFSVHLELQLNAH